MSIFNRLFRAHTKIDGAELCRYKPRHAIVAGEMGVELQLKYVVMKRNLPIIIPLWAIRNIEAFKDANGNFSLELVKGCNVLFQIEASSEYKNKKKQLGMMRGIGISKGKVLDMTELLKKKKEEKEKAEKELKERMKKQKKLREEMAKGKKRVA